MTFFPFCSLGIVKYCEYNIKNFNGDYLLGLSENMTKENHDVKKYLGFNDGIINNLKKINDIKNETGKDIVEPFALLLKTEKFIPLLKQLSKIVDNERKITNSIQSIKGDKVSIKELRLTNAFHLENLMRDCLREITSKYAVKLDDNDDTI